MPLLLTRALLAFLIGYLLMLSFPRAQEGHFGHGHETWHQGFYQQLMRPDGKGSCCNLTDCRPTSGRAVGDHYEVKINGAWISVPTDKILHRTAPDGGFHVCAPNLNGEPMTGERIYCVIVAPEM